MQELPCAPRISRISLIIKNQTLGLGLGDPSLFLALVYCMYLAVKSAEGMMKSQELKYDTLPEYQLGARLTYSTTGPPAYAAEDVGDGRK